MYQGDRKMTDDYVGTCSDCIRWTSDKTCEQRNYELIGADKHCSFWEKGRHPSRLEDEEEVIHRNNIRQLNVALAEGVPPIKWIIESIARERGIAIFGGPSGSFKSWFAMECALACAQEYPLMGQFDTKKVKVLYVDEEMGDIVILNRFKALAKGNQLKEDNLSDVLLSVFNNYKLDNPDIILSLDKTISEYEPDLIIFDSMVRCMQGDEDRSVEVRKIFDNLKEIFNAYDTSFIVLHHTAKGQKGLNALRGSGDFAAFADVVLMFNKLPSGKVRVDFEKNRHIDTTKLQNFTFSVDSDEKEESVRLMFDCFNVENISERDRCITQFIEWIQNNKTESFKIGQVKKVLLDAGFKKYQIEEARKHLLETEIIRQISDSFGQYSVNQDTLLVDKVEGEDV